MNPFELTGPWFLVFYPILVVVGVVAGLVARWMLRGPGATPDDAPVELTADEIACLSGGRKLAIDAAIANLVQRSALAMDATQKRLVAGAEVAGVRSGIESAIRAAVTEEPTGITVMAARQAAADAASEVEHQLEEKDLTPLPTQRFVIRLAPLLIMSIVVICGIYKISIGLDRQKPVTFLVLMTIATGVGSLFFFKPTMRTRKGDAVLANLRREHAALETTARSSPEQLEPADWTLALCLFVY